jgi:hypothetical protein
MMLEIPGLPKNMNGFRTTHTCELCGFEPKTKNKYREKQDHLVMKHFKERIDKIFQHSKPYSCPSADCIFRGKDKQALLRHYTGKHGILEKFLREALAEKGINYLPSENGKRKSSTNAVTVDSVNGDLQLLNGTGVVRPAKMARMCLSPPPSVLGQTSLLDTPPKSAVKAVTLPARQKTEDLQKEVDAMMASFQQPLDRLVLLQNNAITTAQVIPVLENAMVSAAAAGTIGTTIGTVSVGGPGGGPATVVPVVSLSPAIINALTNSVSASSPTIQGANVPTITVGGQVVTSLLSLPQQPNPPAPVQRLLQSAAASPLLQQHLTRRPLSTLVPSASSLPLPIEVITVPHNGLTLSPPSSTSSVSSKAPSPVVENEDVMWSAATVAAAVASVGGPAVIVESANSVPVTCILPDNGDSNFSVTGTLDNIVEYDYLYPSTSNSSDVRERQLEFNML